MSTLVDVNSVEFQELLRKMLRDMLTEFVRENELRARELSLMERVVRVEEELKALREIEASRFEAMEKRFEALQREMNARFEALQREIDTRFEATEKRFESLEKRLNLLQWVVVLGFTLTNVLLVLLSLGR